MRLTVITAAAAHYRIVVMGGGTAGVALSNRFKNLVPKGQMAIIEPNSDHYYQGGFTLVSGGLKTITSCVKPTRVVIHPNSVWIQKSVAELHPKGNSVILDDGSEIKYDVLMVTPGLQLRYDLVEGLPDALRLKGVNSIYRPDFAQKTNRELHAFAGGHALFTFPNTPIKCAGAPQKIMYISDEIFRQTGVRDKTTISYCTSLGRVFGIQKYADALMKIVESKNIQLNIRRNLIKVEPLTRTATFEVLDDCATPTGKTVSFKYDFLHVAPPCSPVKALRECRDLTDEKGWLDVDPQTLLSKKFNNVFGMGDCLNTSNAKTAAAISSQMRAINVNLPALLKGKPLTGKYDGYASCPLMVTMNKVVLAEFNSDGPLETLPLSGAKPRYIGYLLKRYFLPFLYWNFLLKGTWLGPKTIRKILHLGFSK
ncbi:Sulfide:quinone oxidoreductase, mitochondrial [Toxocara canis]|uniref:Sulfide:quinone oxidoreductase, mitochondrial n=2 Tax=Toxocara canis TaxID=6265 RepID=A0A0B2VXE0_TOXCA|nr:Sulfide:quinone oxidoreductase, mitochondrial [Toxocara canis]VDM38550.1 unnamed protein product [Toxocara canis]